MAGPSSTARGFVEPGPTREASVSAVSTSAVLAGAFTAAAVSLILLALGSGLGFASLSPSRGSGPSPTTFTVMTAIWLIVMQWIASAFGGYIAGRLRTKWAGLHTHEVLFRDTAHGFLTWAAATVITAVVLTSGASAIVGSGVQAAATVAGGAAQGASQGATQVAGGALHARAYNLDALFRPAPGAASTAPAAGAGQQENPQAQNGQSQNVPSETAWSEIARILAMGVENGDIPANDRSYMAQLVARHTGVTQEEAQRRVDDVIAKEKAAEAKAREVADKARKAAAAFAFFTALSMLIGAFIASAAAALGGQLRDQHP